MKINKERSKGLPIILTMTFICAVLFFVGFRFWLAWIVMGLVSVADVVYAIKVNGKPKAKIISKYADDPFSLWLDNILDKFDTKAVAYYFNIYQNEKNFSVEFIATNSFNTETDDWATDELYSSRKNNNEFVFNAKDWKNALGIIELFIGSYLDRGKFSKLLKQSKAVACGFVDGDIHIIYREIDEKEIDEYLEKFKPFSKPAKNLVYTNEKTFSKIGGLPDISKTFDWPKYQSITRMKYLPFLMQLKFSEINCDGSLEYFPKSGLLYVFLDEENYDYRLGASDTEKYKVVYIEETDLTEENCEPDHKNGEIIDDVWLFEQTYLKANKITTLPDPFDCEEAKKLYLGRPVGGMDDAYDQLRSETRENNKMHQLGGWPFWIQSSEMENDDDWILFLQIDSDNEKEIMWGDAGMIYFLIKKNDLLAKNFNNMKYYLQCF